MSARLIVDDKNNLHEMRNSTPIEQPAALKIAAKIISYIFHPVFVPMYVMYFLAFVHPYLYTGFDAQLKNTAVMGAGFMAFTFFPVITILLLKGLKFIDTIYLHTQKDRVIPFIACMIWYFWIWYVWNNFGKTRAAIDMPIESIQFAFAAFISTVLGLMVNIKMKVSLHAISMGIVLTFFISMAFTQQLNFGIWLAIVFLLTGIVCTARFIVSDHTAQEIYGGLVTGAVSMMVANVAGNWLA